MAYVFIYFLLSSKLWSCEKNWRCSWRYFASIYLTFIRMCLSCTRYLHFDVNFSSLSYEIWVIWLDLILNLWDIFGIHFLSFVENFKSFWGNLKKFPELQFFLKISWNFSTGLRIFLERFPHQNHRFFFKMFQSKIIRQKFAFNHKQIKTIMKLL